MSRSVITDRKKSATNKHWTAKDKVRAVAAYLVLGSVNKVSEETGIPLGTLTYWKTQPWWFEQIDKIRQGEDQEIDDTFTKIVKKTQSIILERLEQGDPYVDKDGIVRTKPVTIRDAAIVGAIGIDKRQVLRQVPATEQNKIGMQERLKNLELQFTKLVKREENTIDITPVHVTGVHEDSTESDITPIIVEDTDGQEELQEGVRDRIEGAAATEVAQEPSPAGND